METAATTATAAEETRGAASAGQGLAEPVGLGRSESAPPRLGLVYRVKSTVLRRAMMVALAAVTGVVLLIGLTIFAAYGIVMALWEGLKSILGELRLRFLGGSWRPLRVIVLAWVLTWDREAVSDPDAAFGRADEWRKRRGWGRP